MASVRVGTSGWSYRGWVGPFYPARTPTRRMLAAYASRLPTVEAHATHRRLPTAASLQAWAAEVPATFRFAVKAHANISHQRDLAGLDERVARFIGALAPLGPLLGPILVQLPHQQPDLDRLDALLGALAAPLAAAPLAAAGCVPPTVFELAPAWHTAEVAGRLAAAGSALALVERDGDPALASGTPTPVGPVAYVRLRRTSYTRSELEAWAARLDAWTTAGTETYAFVRHDEEGESPGYATTLVEALATLVTERDRASVERLLGRVPRGGFDVAVRGPDGAPVVIRNAPLLDDATPMPTRWWLVDAALTRAVSTLEAAGGVREAESAVDALELAGAHDHYAAERDAALPAGHSGPAPSGGVGGTARGVKCLHAHYAWFLAGGDDPVGRWVHQRLQ